MFDWIRKNPVPSILLIALVIVAVAFGIWSGATYLQDEFNYFDIEPVRGYIERDTTEGVVYHHTASGDVPITNHHRFHLSRGWTAVGYHYHIRRDGDIEVGRPHEVWGAHVASANSTHIGIAFSGNMQDYPPTDEQYESAAELHVWLEHEDGAGYGDLSVSGHSDWASTACPGRYTDLSRLEAEIAQVIIDMEEEEDEELGANTVIIINSYADFPAVEPLMYSLNAPIYLRGVDDEFDTAVVAGGGMDGIEADAVIDLSGESRYETMYNIWEFDEVGIKNEHIKEDIGIVINSYADFPAIEPMAFREDKPIYLRGMDVSYEEAVVAGGGTEGIEADTFVDLSGESRYETMYNIWQLLKN